MDLQITQLTNNNYNPQVNCFVVKLKGKTYFQHHNTIIAKIDKDKNITLSSKWNESYTTMKYLYVFLRDYAIRRDLNSKKDIERDIKAGYIKVTKAQIKY